MTFEPLKRLLEETGIPHAKRRTEDALQYLEGYRYEHMGAIIDEKFVHPWHAQDFAGDGKGERLEETLDREREHYQERYPQARFFLFDATKAEKQAQETTRDEFYQTMLTWCREEKW